jgi:hypothetical protein
MEFVWWFVSGSVAGGMRDIRKALCAFATCFLNLAEGTMVHGRA